MFRADTTFLRSKFGHRLFVLFVSCALLPILVLLLVSYRSVSSELDSQAERRLRELGKSTVMGILARLNLLDVELQLVDHSLAGTAGPDEFVVDPRRFTSLVIESDPGRTETLSGAGFVPPDLSQSEESHLRSGQALLTIQEGSTGEQRVLLARLHQPFAEDEARVLWGEVEPGYLWWGPPAESTLPAETTLLVFLEGLQSPTLSTAQTTPTLLKELSRTLPHRSMGELEWEGPDGVSYRAHYRSTNIRSLYGVPPLTIVVSEEKSRSLQPVLSFKRNLIGVVLLSLWIVLLLTIGQIRRHVEPLQVLRKGTQQIAAGKLDARVEVQSGDELAELGASFNAMAGNLESHFKTLTVSNQLVRAVLSSLDTDRIIDTVLREFHNLLDTDRVVITLTERDSGSVGHLYHRDSGTSQTAGPTIRTLTDRDLEEIDNSPGHLINSAGSKAPNYFLSDQDLTELPILALPIFLNDKLAAVVAASLRDESNIDANALASLRHIADQVAVALSNAKLVEDLDALSWGTLTALGRTIDVRSHWTMGHSERVMDLAQRVGRKMGLPEKSLDSLLRASLLHDIGKIGVPTEILDKRGSLSHEEMTLVRDHVRIGVQILRPVPALKDVLPVVAQHHEWFNGAGYPAGLAGTEICMEARILATVDCYDALRSDRPYRAALSYEAVISYMVEHSGTQFDPEVVESLCSLLSDEQPLPHHEEPASMIGL